MVIEASSSSEEGTDLDTAFQQYQRLVSVCDVLLFRLQLISLELDRKCLFLSFVNELLIWVG